MDDFTEKLEVEVVCWAQEHPQASLKNYAIKSLTPQCKLSLGLGGLTWCIEVPTGYLTEVNPEDGKRKRLWHPVDHQDMVVLQSRSIPKFQVSVVDQSNNTLKLFNCPGQEVGNRAGAGSCDEGQVHEMFKNLQLESISQSLSEGGTDLVTNNAYFKTMKRAETLAEVLDSINGLAQLYNERNPPSKTQFSDPDRLCEVKDPSGHIFDIYLATIKAEVNYAQEACANAVACSGSHPQILTIASCENLQQVGWNSKELQWCEIAFDPSSFEVECTLRLSEFMDNPTVATALGFRQLELPLRVSIVPNKVQMESKEWNGDVDVYVSQLQSDWHNHISEEICGFQFLVPRIVQNYLHHKFSTYLPTYPHFDTSGLKCGLFLGLLQTLVRQLTNLNSGGCCCVCGKLTGRPTSIHLDCKSLWPCKDNLCQATYLVWQELSSVDSQREREEAVQLSLIEENLRENFSEIDQQALTSALLDVDNLSDGQRISAMAKMELWNLKDLDASALGLSRKREKPKCKRAEPGCSEGELQESQEADKEDPCQPCGSLLGPSGSRLVSGLDPQGGQSRM